jgi:phospholipid N-methyltransferase
MENLQQATLARATGSTKIQQTVLFAKNFFKHPRLLGSFVPSSPFLVNQLLAPVDWRRASVVVEYGPGIGNITRQVLKRMRPDAVLVAIEMNSEFVEFLRSDVDDPRLQVVEGSALDIREILAGLRLPPVDYIISGIPYTNIPHELRCDILRESRGMLQPDGAMLVYQFTRTVLPYLQRTFGRVHQDFTLLNILPARIFHCTS